MGHRRGLWWGAAVLGLCVLGLWAQAGAAQVAAGPDAAAQGVAPDAVAQGVAPDTVAQGAARQSGAEHHDAAAQDQAPFEAPLSAIDWLSDSFATPTAPGEIPSGPPAAGDPSDSQAGTSQTPANAHLPGTAKDSLHGVAPVEQVTVAPLDGPNSGGAPGADRIGLLPAATTGLPTDLWGPGRAEDVARRIRGERAEMVPALQALLQTILLAELAPPSGAAPSKAAPSDRPAGPAGSTGHAVFLARVDKLLDMGALDQANALLERAPQGNPEIIRRHFDVALLRGAEQPICAALTRSPALSPTYQARIFCHAQAGDWDQAALLLGTGNVLGLIPPDQVALLGRFLDPELYEGEPALALPRMPTPLTFRMFEAIGEAIPTAGLPLAFAHSDLRANIGWKARVEAGERLARTGAVSDNQLYGLYSEQRPAASGGVWDRVAAVQAVERALAAGHRAGTAEALPALWAALSQARVEVPISRILGPQLAALDLDGDAGARAFRMALLSADYEAEAVRARPETDADRLLVAVARGLVAPGSGTNARERAVVEGFTAAAAPPRLAGLVDEGRLGEAILRAIALFSEGMSGDLDQVADGLALLRAVGLEDSARRAALEFLILDRQG